MSVPAVSLISQKQSSLLLKFIRSLSVASCDIVDVLHLFLSFLLA